MNTEQIKQASTKFKVTELIKNRFSTVAFADKMLTNDDMNSIFEAATWAASANNEQPWRYIAALKQNNESFNKIVDLLMPGNQPWAKNAAVLIVCYAKLTFTLNGKPNVTALHDVGMANENMLLQSLSMGIYGHIMGGFDRERSKEVFNLDDDHQPICVIALGYLGDPESLIEPYKTREHTSRSRKPVNEVVTFI